MKIPAAFFLVLLALFLGSAVGVAAVSGPYVEARALAVEQPDPYEQLLSHQETGARLTAVTVGLVVTSLFLVGIGYFALSERHTKMVKARTAWKRQAAKQARAPARVPPMQVQGTAENWLEF